ncbi:MAG: ATP-dependent RecD-like DNA helicase [Ktedonobacterales bacterium]
MPTLAGTLERIVFRNQETHFTVARLAPDTRGRLFRDELVTLVGVLVGVNVGELMEVTGEWQAHPVHGRHLRVTSFVTHTPVTAAGLRRYLGSGVIKGIGPKTALRIVEHFGEQTLVVIELEPERLEEVKGISAGKRAQIVNGWAEQREIRDLMLFLQEYGVSPSLGTKIYRQYGKQSINVIRENPYLLERDIRGVGFKTADALAVQLGLPRDGVPRFMTGIKHVLSDMASTEGHCYLGKQDLFNRAARLLEVPPEQLEAALEQLISDREVFAEAEHMYLAPFYYAENGTARRLRLILKTPSPLPPVRTREWATTFAALEREHGIHLAERQKEAVKLAYVSKVSVLTGGPGVGKTTTIRALLDTLDAQQISYALAAPTGRAAKRMTEATGRPARTLHRLLEFQPGNNDFAYNEHRPLPQQFVIVDEASMLDILLAYRLVKALSAPAHLLLVGDADQLPSVGPGSVFRDIIASESIPVVRLTELFRQARESAIVVTAHGVQAGVVPTMQSKSASDFFFIQASDPMAAQRLVADLVARRLPAHYGFDPVRDIQVLAPMYRGPAGVTALNEVLQSRLNPTTGSLSIVYGDHAFCLGDKIMSVHNNYDKGPAGVFNGDLGRVVKVEPEAQQMWVEFLDDAGTFSVGYESHELDELTLAYACSIHRAQGSEYPCVVLPLVSQHSLMLQRNLLYTAITRARQLCVLVGDPRALRRAVENTSVASRNTGLAERLLAPQLLHANGNWNDESISPVAF